jgi:predicted porin
MAMTLVLPLSLVEARWSLTPRIYVEEMYDDNIFLTETNEENDFVTTVSPGINFTYETPTENVSLDYEYRRSLYSDFNELDFSQHRARGDARKDFGARFSAGIRETFISSEDPLEYSRIETFEVPSVRQRRRNRYIRNILEPEATYRFGENRSFTLGYRNNLLRNDEDDIADLDENTINGRLNYRINVRNGFEISSRYSTINYDSTTPPEPSRDSDGYEIGGRYIYYFNPTLSAYVGYRYYKRDFDKESPGFTDYDVHSPGAGFNWDVRETITVSGSAGYSHRDADNRDDEDTFSGRGDVVARYKRLTLDVYGEAGFDEDLTSSENLGFNEFWGGGINATYQVLERLSASGLLYFRRDRFADRPRTDDYWNIRGGLNYQVLKWLLLSFDYTYNKRDSNALFESYTDNRYFGRLTALYDVAERYQ